MSSRERDLKSVRVKGVGPTPSLGSPPDLTQAMVQQIQARPKLESRAFALLLAQAGPCRMILNLSTRPQGPTPATARTMESVGLLLGGLEGQGGHQGL